MKKKLFAAAAAIAAALAIPATALAYDPYTVLNNDMFSPASSHEAYFEYITCGAPSGTCLDYWGAGVSTYIYTDQCGTGFPQYCTLYYSDDYQNAYCYLYLEFPSSSSYYPWIVTSESGGSQGCTELHV